MDILVAFVKFSFNSVVSLGALSSSFWLDFFTDKSA